MQCPCGASTTYHTHQVKTLKTAQLWYPQGDLTEADLPIKIGYEHCPGCGMVLIHQPTRKDEA